MGWLSSLFKGSELERLRLEAEDERERSERAAHEFERWNEALGPERTTSAVALAHTTRATAAAARDDVAGWAEALEQLQLARAAFVRGRAELARARPRAAALLLLADASAATDGIEDPEDRSALAGRIGVLQAEAGDIEGARTTLERVTASFDRAHVLRAITIARGATSEALAEYQHALSALPDLDDDWFDVEGVVPAVVGQLCLQLDLAGAEALANGVTDPEWQAQALKTIAECKAYGGLIDEARAIAARIAEPSTKAEVYATIAVALAGDGQIEAGLRAAEDIDDDAKRGTAKAGIAAELASRGEDARAMAMAEELDPVAREDALRDIARARIQRRDFGAAREALAKHATDDLRRQGLVELAAALHQAGRQEEADAALDQALDAAAYTHSSHPEMLAQIVVDARAELGQLEAAEAVVETIGDERRRSELLASIASRLFRRPGDDLTALDGLRERHPGPWAQIAMLHHGAAALLGAALRAESSEPPADPRGD